MAGTEALESRRLLAADLFLTQVSVPSGIVIPTNAYQPVSSNQTADLNGDGKADLVLTQSNSRNVTVLLGNGDGTFQAPATLDAGADQGPVGVAVGDVNGDGFLDIAVLTYASIPQLGSISVYHGHGDGTFAPLVSVAAVPGVGSLHIADFNGDGRADFAYSNGGGPAVILQNADGTFQAAANYSAGGQNDNVAVGDLNGDGRPDIVVTNHTFYYGGDAVGVLLNNGDGTFGAVTLYGATDNDPEGAAVLDFNGDGKNDIIEFNAGHSTANGLQGNIGILLNDGTGTSFTGTGYGDTPDGFAVGDFNGDGHPDFATSAGGVTKAYISHGDGTFFDPLSFAAGPGPNADEGLVAADFDGDGHVDVLLVSRDSTSITELVNTGNTQVLVTKPTVTLTISPLNATAGAPVTYTAKVTPSTAGFVVPTGTVTFTANFNHVNIAALGTAQLVANPDGSATATLVSAGLTAGDDGVYASYGGDGYYSTWSSDFISTTVHASGGGGGGGGGGPVTTTLALGKVSVPTSSVVLGSAVKISVPVDILNGTSAASGSYLVGVYLFPDAGDAGPVLLGSTTKSLKLKARQKVAVSISAKSLPTTLTAGTYHLVARVVDPASGVSTVTATPTLTVVVPTVSLSASIPPAKALSVKPGKTGTITVSVTNTGNVEADGALTFTLSPSSDGTTPIADTVLVTATKPEKLKPGKPLKYKLTFNYGSTITAGEYFPIVTVSGDGTSATTAGTVKFTLT